MKAFFAALLVALVIAIPVQAACPNITGPFFLGPYSWYEYRFALSCAGTTGSVGTSTLSCFGDPAHTFTGSGTVQYSYTVSAGDPYINYTKWQVAQFFDFNDPSNSNTNTLNASVSVTHNGSTTSYTILNYNGSIGDLSCARYDYFYFTAVAGDTITVTVTATNFNSPNTVIKAGSPILFNG
jgi:hypothetical protein